MWRRCRNRTAPATCTSTTSRSVHRLRRATSPAPSAFHRPLPSASRHDVRMRRSSVCGSTSSKMPSTHPPSSSASTSPCTAMMLGCIIVLLPRVSPSSTRMDASIRKSARARSRASPRRSGRTLLTAYRHASSDPSSTAPPTTAAASANKRRAAVRRAGEGGALSGPEEGATERTERTVQYPPVPRMPPVMISWKQKVATEGGDGPLRGMAAAATADDGLGVRDMAEQGVSRPRVPHLLM
mmetsp:Transcript_47916/g.93624  ORF Transcript_47916/g.93624 Transcript_47916/m.93624 type:complete len:240 (-) Transcript_47916:12-731(-)